MNVTEKYNLTHLSTCYPDYFSGYPKPVLAVLVWNGMTADEFVEAIATEYSTIWEHLTYDDAWPDLSSDEITELARNLLKDPNDANVFPMLEKPETQEEWEEYNIYSYIAIEEG